MKLKNHSSGCAKKTTSVYGHLIWSTRTQFIAILRNLQSTPILLVVLSIVLPMTILFVMDPNSFSLTWKGRTFYLFFLWLLLLELILDWEKFKVKTFLSSRRISVLVIFLILPTAYVVAVNYLEGRSILLATGEFLRIPIPEGVSFTNWFQNSWVLSIEYLIFTLLFSVTIWISYKLEGLKALSSSIILLGAIGSVYMIDTLYPYGYFTPLQTFVPFTASLAAVVLGLLGYQTESISYYGMPTLRVLDSSGQVLTPYYSIGWPCAGVQSLLIYTFVMLLFLKKANIPNFHKLVYFSIGAVITYGINILRIVTIYLVYIWNLNRGTGAATSAMSTFHEFYGGLFAMTWIVLYPLLIIGTRILWTRIHSHMTS
ncbi:MAG: hypothetical protein JSV35_02315 [Candidatus Bathyarchaeota archaeon]|nr:MAG: hypothetical protein JSV35_02315 [Candidatus Bathyarchaeota archaeon]